MGSRVGGGVSGVGADRNKLLPMLSMYGLSSRFILSSKSSPQLNVGLPSRVNGVWDILTFLSLSLI